MFRVLVWLVLAVPFAHAQEKPEPRYRGKPLAYWVERLEKAESFELQRDAAEAIIAFEADAKPAIPELVRMLDDRSSDFRWLVANVLSKLGPHAKDAVPVLVKKLQDGTVRDPKQLIGIFGDLGPDAKEALSALVQMYRKGKHQEGILEAFRKIRVADEEVVQLMIELLASETQRVQAIAVLGYFGPDAKDAVPALEPFLKHKTSWLRMFAAISLWKINKHPDVIRVLTEMLSENHYEHSAEAVCAFAEIGPEAKAALPAFRKAYDGVAKPNSSGQKMGWTHHPTFIENKQAEIKAAIAKIEAAPKK